MWSILVFFNKRNPARVASCWFIIYYRLMMYGNSNIEFLGIPKKSSNIIYINFNITYYSIFGIVIIVIILQ